MLWKHMGKVKKGWQMGVVCDEEVSKVKMLLRNTENRKKRVCLQTLATDLAQPMLSAQDSTEKNLQ